MKVVIYARYSCEKQTEQSIEGQVRECREFADKHDMTIVDTYIDRAISGTSTAHRDAFLKMIADAECHLFDGILVYKIDRFARNRYDSAIYKARLKKIGIKIFYAKENIPDGPEGIIMESLLEGMAEYYSAELSQKIKRGMRENALKGKVTGGAVALGYKIGPDKRYEIDEEKADIVRHIFQSYASGKRVADICRELNALGIRTSRGAEFNKNSLRTMLHNEKYIGVYKCQDIRLEDMIPPIISKELFQQVQDLLEKNKKAPASAKAKVDYMLSGKAYCGKCGMGLVGESGNSKSGMHYYYKCAKRKRGQGCDKETVRKSDLENLVAEEVINVVLRPEKIREIAERCEALQKKIHFDHPEVRMIEKQLAQTKKSLHNLMQAIEQGVFTKTTKCRLEELENQQETLEYELLQAKEKETLENQGLTADQIEFMLLQFLPDSETEIDCEKYISRIIDCFVHSVYLWDDKCVIWLNISPEDSVDKSERMQISVDIANGALKKNMIYNVDKDVITDRLSVGEKSDLNRKSPPIRVKSEQLYFADGTIALALTLETKRKR